MVNCDTKGAAASFSRDPLTAQSESVITNGLFAIMGNSVRSRSQLYKGFP
jgi:hypothetical protein